MRLDKVYIDGFKNLKQLEVVFDEREVTTVVIGQNGAGKSNLIEAIIHIFRWADLRRNEPRFHYRVDYRIGGARVTLLQPARRTGLRGGRQGRDARRLRAAQGRVVSRLGVRLLFGRQPPAGGLVRCNHQRRYYDAIKREGEAQKCADLLWPSGGCSTAPALSTVCWPCWPSSPFPTPM